MLIADGTVFGDLTVVAVAAPRGRIAYYSVVCVCGTTKDVRGSDLLRIDRRALKACSSACSQRRQSHGGRLSPTYHTGRKPSTCKRSNPLSNALTADIATVDRRRLLFQLYRNVERNGGDVMTSS